MKKFLVFLIPIIFTLLVLVLPDWLFEKNDESYGAGAYEYKLDIQVAEDISVSKMIDVAADEGSRFIEYDYGEDEQMAQAEHMEIGLEVLKQLDDILSMEIPDKEAIVKNGYCKKVNVVGNSEYNSYMFALCEIILMTDNAEFHVLYLPDREEILSANMYCFNGYYDWFDDGGKEFKRTLEKYYGHGNWFAEIFESELYFNQGTDREAIQIISDKMAMLNEEYPRELDVAESEE